MNVRTIVRKEHILKSHDIKELIAKEYHIPVESISCDKFYSFKFVTEEEIKNEDIADE